MTDSDRRALLLQDLDAISPWDLMEAKHLQETAAWIRDGSPLDRTVFDEPDPHLVAYFVVTDPDREELLLGHHRKAGLRLPSGGHVEPGELPWQTVVREVEEELRLPAVPLLGRNPLFVTRTPTVSPRSHTDVSYWFVLRAHREDVAWFDPGEYFAVEWLSWRQVLDEPLQQLDPNMHRFTSKLLAAVTTG
ncbi:NUDIX domain-containing protein [Streptacidiphilus griseoplanus]|uniref:NUDIX domain-containing protein n=1 Tax=Peterkaempfera griseoplana TaxID=66896 RepID=UPI0006E1693F|nr:NUDIX domain-containing protein [Peterkaempfera griseoplana]